MVLLGLGCLKLKILNTDSIIIERIRHTPKRLILRVGMKFGEYQPIAHTQYITYITFDKVHLPRE